MCVTYGQIFDFHNPELSLVNTNCLHTLTVEIEQISRNLQLYGTYMSVKCQNFVSILNLTINYTILSTPAYDI